MQTAKKLLANAFLGAAIIVFATPAVAEWPTQPVQIVVPWKAGGLADSVARAFQSSIEENKLQSQPLVVINMGGHFSIGMRRVKEAEPLGKEFLLANIAIMAGEGSGVMDFGFRDFEAVAETGESCFVPTVRSGMGVDSLATLAERAKSGEPLIVGVNIGANNHVASAMLEDAFGKVSFRYTQTGGDTANYTALKGEQIDLSFLSAAAISKFAFDEQGKIDESVIRPLAYMGTSRHPKLPDLPTATEAGFDASFCMPMWWFAPKGTPGEAVSGLADVLEKAHKTERVQAFYEDRMIAPSFQRGDALNERMADLWRDIEPKAAQVRKGKSK